MLEQETWALLCRLSSVVPPSSVREEKRGETASVNAVWADDRLAAACFSNIHANINIVPDIFF